MVMDLAVELIHATVQLEQPLGDGTRTVGTGFLISAPGVRWSTILPTRSTWRGAWPSLKRFA